jgi:autotransporter-associated beta strand protein
MVIPVPRDSSPPSTDFHFSAAPHIPTSMKTHRSPARYLLPLMSLVCGVSSLPASWLPSTGGTYNYAAPGNWSGGTIDNTFLPSSYSGTAQTITVNSALDWLSTQPVTTAHSNNTNLLFRANGTDLSLALAGVNYTTTTNNAANLLQFGTVTSGQGLAFTLSDTVNIHAATPQTLGADPALNSIIFNSALTGTGGLLKTGNGSLYLQNAASTFTGPLDVRSGRVFLTTASATLGTEAITLGRGDSANGFRQSTYGVLMLANNVAPLGSTSGSTGTNTNRISNSAIITMNGGGLALNGSTTGSITETVGTIKLNRGNSSLMVTPPDYSAVTTNVATLAIGDLQREHGTTLSAAATNPGFWGLKTLGVDGKITASTINGQSVASSLVNGILPWAVQASGTEGNAIYGDFLTYGANGFEMLTTFATNINTATSTDNVKLTAATSLSASRQVNSLTIAGNNGALTGTGQTLTLTSGAINAYRDYTGLDASIGTNMNFNGREGIVFVQRSLGLNLTGNLSNTGGNGLTFSAVAFGLSGATPYLRLSGTNTYTGTTTINGGALQIRGANALPTATDVVINEGGSLELGGFNIAVASLSGMGTVDFVAADSVTAGSATLTVGSGNTNTTYAGIIRNGGTGAFSGNVVKTGSGALTLTGTSTYTGTTDVQSGTLIVDGSIASSSLTTVESGASLAGGGAVGNLHAAAGSSIRPGSGSLDTLSATSFTWDGGAQMDFQLSLLDSTSDQLSLSGSFAKGTSGAYLFDFQNTGFFDGLAATEYVLLTFASTDFLASDFSYVNLASGLEGEFLVSGNNLVFSVTAVPEPSALALLALGSVLLSIRRRRA